MIASLSFKTGDLIFFFVRESHLTDFPQAMAWAEAKAEPAEAYEHGLGFSFGRPRPRKAKLYQQLSGRAELGQHYSWWGWLNMHPECESLFSFKKIRNTSWEWLNTHLACELLSNVWADLKCVQEWLNVHPESESLFPLFEKIRMNGWTCI